MLHSEPAGHSPARAAATLSTRSPEAGLPARPPPVRKLARRLPLAVARVSTAAARQAPLRRELPVQAVALRPPEAGPAPAPAMSAENQTAPWSTTVSPPAAEAVAVEVAAPRVSATAAALESAWTTDPSDHPRPSAVVVETAESRVSATAAAQGIFPMRPAHPSHRHPPWECLRQHGTEGPVLGWPSPPAAEALKARRATTQQEKAAHLF